MQTFCLTWIYFCDMFRYANNVFDIDDEKERKTMTELTVKKSELRVRQKSNTSGYLPIWEVVSVTMFSDGTVSRIVLCERDSEESAFATIEKVCSKSGTDAQTEYTPDMVEAVEQAKGYDYQALLDRWDEMSPVEVIGECKEVLRIYDILQQTPEPLGLDGISADGFSNALLFLESFCMRYLVDIFFNEH